VHLQRVISFPWSPEKRNFKDETIYAIGAD
jgi:hypothetical protein